MALIYRLGDGICQDAFNSEYCMYDFGDCCLPLNIIADSGRDATCPVYSTYMDTRHYVWNGDNSLDGLSPETVEWLEIKEPNQVCEGVGSWGCMHFRYGGFRWAETFDHKTHCGAMAGRCCMPPFDTRLFNYSRHVEL
jgi:hypothetical protein